MKNTYRLGTQEAALYGAFLDSAKIEIFPTDSGRQSGYAGQAVVSIGDGDMQFDILMDVSNGKPIEPQFEAARSVLSQLIEMDDTARELPTGLSDELDHDEVLARIKMQDESTAIFRYFATTVNTEWDVKFSRELNGKWRCQGYCLPSTRPNL